MFLWIIISDFLLRLVSVRQFRRIRHFRQIYTFRFPLSVFRSPFSASSACLGHDGFAFDTGDAAQSARQGVDAVNAAFDNKRNHRHSALLKRQPLPTKTDVGIVRNDWIDKCRLTAVGHENCYCSYSLFHQGSSACGPQGAVFSAGNTLLD